MKKCNVSVGLGVSGAVAIAANHHSATCGPQKYELENERVGVPFSSPTPTPAPFFLNLGPGRRRDPEIDKVMVATPR